MAPKQRQKESKEERLARKGANQDQLKALVTELDGSFHQRKLVPASLQQHDAIWASWQDFAVTLGISPDITRGQEPPSEGTLLRSNNNNNCKLPISAQFKGFARYLSAITVGRITDEPHVETIRHKLVTFMATWTRRSSVAVPQSVRQQVVAYFNSAEFQSEVPLNTASREKRVAHTIDVELLIDAMWVDETHFRNLRERLTAVCLTTIQSITNDRPGSFTTNYNRPDCTDSITHAHIDIRVHPNPDAPQSPFVYSLIKLTDIKGGYKDDSIFKYIVLYPEPDGSRAMCPVTSFVSLLLMDDVFENIHTAEEPFHPKHPPTHAYSVPIKSKWLSLSVFRVSHFDRELKQWKTHHSKAIPYKTYYQWLRHFSLTRGFHRKLLPSPG